MILFLLTFSEWITERYVNDIKPKDNVYYNFDNEANQIRYSVGCTSPCSISLLIEREFENFRQGTPHKKVQLYNYITFIKDSIINTTIIKSKVYILCENIKNQTVKSTILVENYYKDENQNNLALILVLSLAAPCFCFILALAIAYIVIRGYKEYRVVDPNLLFGKDTYGSLN